MNRLASNRAYHPILHEIRDEDGNWVTGWKTYSDLAETVGTTVADLMRRLAILGVVEMRDGRHRLTRTARIAGHGTVHWQKTASGKTIGMDLILPGGMVFLVQNLQATNASLTETERLANAGLSLSAIAARLGISKQAVHKRLIALPPRLKDWPVLGTWAEEGEADNDNSVNLSVSAA
jgi:hypothetical protein